MDSLSGRQMSIDVLCKGCLSYDRRCNIIVDNADLFLKILDPNNDYKKLEEMDLLLCWECEATLKSIRTFQNKIQQAQGFLQQITEQQIEHKSLSSLTIAKIPEYNLIINDNNEITIKNIKTVPKIPIVALTRTNFDNIQINSKLDIQSNIEIKTEDDKLLNTEKKAYINIVDEDHKLPILSKGETIINDLNEQLLQISSTENLVFNPDDIDVKKEGDDFYWSDVNNQCSDYGLEEIKQEESNEENNVKKKKKSPKIEKRKEVDFNNIDQYFSKINISKEEYMVHLKKQADIIFLRSKYRCTICVLVFENRKSLLLHEKMHKASKGEYQCDICKLKFQTQEDMSSHQSTHLSVVRCSICHYICRYDSVKLSHMRSAHGITGYYQCRHCSLLYGSRIEFTSHLKDMHRRFLCNDCGKRKNSKRTLQIHIYSQHVYKVCHLCPKKYKDQYKLQKHLVVTHDLVKSYHSKEEMYCVECDKQYPTIAKYKNNLKHNARHKPSLKQSIPCPACGKIFSRKSYMNNHFICYHGEGRFRCEPCNKSFCRNDSLKRHIERVHEKVPIPKTKVCKTCGQSFSSNTILKRHIRTHTGERPHACDYCPARFGQKYARDVHVKNIHLKHK